MPLHYITLPLVFSHSLPVWQNPGRSVTVMQYFESFISKQAAAMRLFKTSTAAICWFSPQSVGIFRSIARRGCLQTEFSATGLLLNTFKITYFYMFSTAQGLSDSGFLSRYLHEIFRCYSDF